MVIPEGDRCLTLLGNSLRESLNRDNQVVAALLVGKSLH